MYLHSRSSRHFHSLGFSYTPMCPIIADGLHPRDELLDREIFYTLKEVQVLVEQWRQTYNRIRPHSSLGYRPPALVASASVDRDMGPQCADLR